MRGKRLFRNRWARRGALVLVLMFSSCNGLSWLTADRGSDVFQPEALRAIASSVVEDAKSGHWSRDRTISELVSRLRARYPGKIKTRPEWIFNNAGGALIEFELLSCGLKEYLGLVGAPMPTGGFSGIYPEVDIYDYYFSGAVSSYVEGDFTKTEHPAGSMSFLKAGQSWHYEASDHYFALEYAHGNVATLFPFGVFASGWNGLLGWKYAWRTIWSCLRS